MGCKVKTAMAGKCQICLLMNGVCWLERIFAMAVLIYDALWWPSDGVFFPSWTVILAMRPCLVSRPTSSIYDIDDCKMNGSRQWTVGKRGHGFDTLPDRYTPSTGWLKSFHDQVIAAIGL